MQSPVLIKPQRMIKFEVCEVNKSLSIFLLVLLVFSFAACSANTEPIKSSDLSKEEQIAHSENEDTSIQSTNEQDTDGPNSLAEEANNNHMKLQIGDYAFTATLAENSSVAALRDMLENGPIIIDMQDYGSMEKVGSLGTSLPRNDKQITTEPGDLILYQGNTFVIYYAPNSWNFTRLGKIYDVSQEELKEALGNGDVKVTLSLE
jgi:hypothetical protein